jgi:hypothetical protein
MVLVRSMFTLTVTIVQDKTKITTCCGTSAGEMLHTSIHLSFLIAGHTKFAPDWCFGLIKTVSQNRNIM